MKRSEWLRSYSVEIITNFASSIAHQLREHGIVPSAAPAASSPVG